MSATRSLLAVVGLAMALAACGGDDEPPTSAPVYITHYDRTQSWACDQSVSCQDVYNIDFTAGTIVSLGVVDLTDQSIAQIALYAPGVPLGGTNLLTGTANEYLCNTNGDCDAMPEQTVTDFALPRAASTGWPSRATGARAAGPSAPTGW
jgi:hypothetical protein